MTRRRRSYRFTQRIRDTWNHSWMIRWSMGYRIHRLRQGLAWERRDPDQPAAEHMRRFCAPWRPLGPSMRARNRANYRQNVRFLKLRLYRRPDEWWSYYGPKTLPLYRSEP
jgi:hypothetical protein